MEEIFSIELNSGGDTYAPGLSVFASQEEARNHLKFIVKNSPEKVEGRLIRWIPIPPWMDDFDNE